MHAAAYDIKLYHQYQTCMYSREVLLYVTSCMWYSILLGIDGRIHYVGLSVQVCSTCAQHFCDKVLYMNLLKTQRNMIDVMLVKLLYLSVCFDGRNRIYIIVMKNVQQATVWLNVVETYYMFSCCSSPFRCGVTMVMF